MQDKYKHINNKQKGDQKMSKLRRIEGIGETFAVRLDIAGVTSIEELLNICATKKGRTELAEKTGISEKLVLRWANQADLTRVKGIGGEYAELLEAAGVDTIPELSIRKAENLYIKMKEINAQKSLVRKLPTQSQVEDWILQADVLPRVLQY